MSLRTLHIGLCHAVSDGAGDRASRHMGRSDSLMQAAESLYGAGVDMAGGEWPRTKSAETPSTGAFLVPSARAFKLLAVAVGPGRIKCSFPHVVEHTL